MFFTIPEAAISSKLPDVSSYIAFFDLDRTISRAVSGNELALSAYKEKLLPLSGIIHALWMLAGYKLSLRDPQQLIYIMTMWVKGIPEQTLNTLSAGIVNDKIIPGVYPKALDEIKRHSLNNAMTVILSSSPLSVCRLVAQSIGIDDVICSRLEVENGNLTGRSVGPLCFGNEKAVRLREYCENNNTDPQDCWYYGDAFADFPALSAVGHPVCVNPEKELLRKAREQRWKICYWD